MPEDIVAPSIREVLRNNGIAHSAMSWNGFNLFGDAKSIQEVHRLMHEADRAKALEAMLMRNMKSAIGS